MLVMAEVCIIDAAARGMEVNYSMIVYGWDLKRKLISKRRQYVSCLAYFMIISRLISFRLVLPIHFFSPEFPISRVAFASTRRMCCRRSF